jgi:phosphoribosylanthranilate isomerase
MITMALKTLVKLSNVNNLSDARYGAGMGVSLIGFNFSQKAGKAITKESFSEITGWISGVELVAEFTDEPFEEIEKALDGFEIQYIQTENTEVIGQAQAMGVPVIYKANSISLLNTLPEGMLKAARFVLLESSAPLDDETLTQVGKMAVSYPLIVGGDVQPANLEKILESSVTGIALQGGDEIRPGFKDFDSMADILEQLETE